MNNLSHGLFLFFWISMSLSGSVLGQQIDLNLYPIVWTSPSDNASESMSCGGVDLGLQEMLMQTLDDKIYLFPDWPKDWVLNFKVHAPYHIPVEGVIKDRKVICLKVTPESRRSDMEITFSDTTSSN